MSSFLELDILTFLRLLVISVGSGMTLYYFWATYFAQ